MLDIKQYFNSNYINPLYVNRYIKFITSIHNKNRKYIGYKEKHHIIPKCVNSPLYTNKDNIIILTAREHYVAHLILSKCFLPGTNEYNRLIFALFAMSKLRMNYHNRGSINITSRQYELLRLKYSTARREYMKEAVKDDKYKALIGRNKPSTIAGKRCITNGSVNKFINKDEDIPIGWKLGATQIHKDKESWRNNLIKSWNDKKQNRVGKNHPMYNKGYLIKGNKNGRYGKSLKYINNGVKNKMVPPNEVDNYINNGWKLGMIRINKK